MDKVTLCLLVILHMLREYYLCTGMVVQGPTGTGGSLNGDPAPGRSPGPPQILTPRHRNIQEQPTLILTSETSEIDCTLDGDTQILDKGDMNFTLRHQFFKTDALVPGVIYQGKILKSSHTFTNIVC